MHYTGKCPQCLGDGKLKVSTYTPAPGRLKWSVHCRSSECDPPGGNWLCEVAELVGYTQTEILDDPLRCLADYLDAEVAAKDAEQLPSDGTRAGERSRLFSDVDGFYPLNWLLEQRGLNEETIRERELGWNGSAFTFPIRDRQGDLVNVVRRPWPASRGPKYRAMAGRGEAQGGVQLYPLPLPNGSWLLVEGLLDALLGRQHGLPVVSPTHGVSSFPAAYLPLLRGRRVAVAFDVGVEQVTRHRVEQLRAAGARAWSVRLDKLGLPPKGDLTDYLSNGGTAQELIAHVRQAKETA